MRELLEGAPSACCWTWTWTASPRSRTRTPPPCCPGRASVIREFLLPPDSEPFWDAVLGKCVALTLAREPHHCGGLLASGCCFADAAEVLFRELLRRASPPEAARALHPLPPVQAGGGCRAHRPDARYAAAPPSLTQEASRDEATCPPPARPPRSRPRLLARGEAAVRGSPGEARDGAHLRLLRGGGTGRDARAAKDLGYHAFPYRDSSTELLTAWRFNGRSVSGSVPHHAGAGLLRPAQALGPRLSVARIFRIVNTADGIASAPWPRAPPSWTGWPRCCRARGAPRRTGSGRRPRRRTARTSPPPTSAMATGPRVTGTRWSATRASAASTACPARTSCAGANERGVRDRELERELVQRLEQFASLEFTGGAYDVPAAARRARRTPPVTRDWEREDGGTPFRGPRPLRPAHRRAGAARQPGHARVLVGEQLGTREVPAAVGNMACELAQRGAPRAAGPRHAARRSRTRWTPTCAATGSRADQDALLAGSFWRQVPRDGRSSRALVVLLERVRRWRAGGLDIQPVAYDARGPQGQHARGGHGRAAAAAPPRAAPGHAAGAGRQLPRAQPGRRAVEPPLPAPGLPARPEGRAACTAWTRPSARPALGLRA